MAVGSCVVKRKYSCGRRRKRSVGFREGDVSSFGSGAQGSGRSSRLCDVPEEMMGVHALGFSVLEAAPMPQAWAGQPSSG